MKKIALGMDWNKYRLSALNSRAFQERNMLGKILSGVVGAKVAKKLDGQDAGLAGALIGVAAPVVIARVVKMGPIGWAAAIAAGYAAGRIIDRFRAPEPSGAARA